MRTFTLAQMAAIEKARRLREKRPRCWMQHRACLGCDALRAKRKSLSQAKGARS